LEIGSFQFFQKRIVAGRKGGLNWMRVSGLLVERLRERQNAQA
jgi:hypothetical protein